MDEYSKGINNPILISKNKKAKPSPDDKEEKRGEVISLDSFRKKP